MSMTNIDREERPQGQKTWAEFLEWFGKVTGWLVDKQPHPPAVGPPQAGGRGREGTSSNAFF